MNKHLPILKAKYLHVCKSALNNVKLRDVYDVFLYISMHF